MSLRITTPRKGLDALAAIRFPASSRQQRHASFQSTRKQEASHVAPVPPETVSIPSKPEAPVFARLPTKLLLRSLLITTVSSHRFLLSPSLAILSFLTRSRGFLFNPERNPLIRGILKKTIYDHFCAGETETQTRDCIREIKEMGYRGVILTYAKEMVADHRKQSHQSTASTDDATAHCEIIDAWKNGTLQTVDMLSDGDYLALKLTGAGPKVTEAFASGTSPPAQFLAAVDEICQRAMARNTRILMDIEQHAYINGIHSLSLSLMQKYNRNGSAVVFNAYQAYLKSTPETLASHLRAAAAQKDPRYVFAIKLVRGAYINSDPRALIHDTKQHTDDAYDAIVRGVLTRDFHGLTEPDFPTTELFLASHNKHSVHAAHEMHQDRVKRGLPSAKTVQYGQLMGMADSVSLGLLRVGEHEAPETKPAVYKCLQWGRMGDCLGYLVRRAVENRDAVARTGVEHAALKGEVGRRLRGMVGLAR